MNTRDTSVLEEVGGQTQLLLAAVNASISGVIITDWQQPDNPIIYCNKAFEEMTGYCEEEILGKNCRFLQSEDREQVSRFILQDAIAKEEPCSTEIANYRKDGSIFYNELYISPIKNAIGVVTHYIGIQNDITQRRLKEASVQLEYANSKKLQQQKDDFTSIASHELKTPVTSLKATLQLINRIIEEKPETDGRLIQLSKNAERHINKLTYLVNDLLNTTKVLQGEVPLNKTMFPIAELVDGCCSHVALSGTHRVENIGDHNIEIFADHHQLAQVMNNLVENAVRFAPTAREIKIEVEKMEQRVRISVADTGQGIAQEDLPHLFDRYYKPVKEQMHTSGLGLGLYIASEIIKRHGGEMGVESEPGKGSKFWFILPVE